MPQTHATPSSTSLSDEIIDEYKRLVVRGLPSAALRRMAADARADVSELKLTDAWLTSAIRKQRPKFKRQYVHRLGQVKVRAYVRAYVRASG